jgi:uncharacterized protein (DUF1015 family)
VAERTYGFESANEQVNGNDYNYFMTIIYPSDNLRIMDYNRVLKTLNDLSPQDFLAQMADSFEIQPSDTVVNTTTNTMGLYLEKAWYKCDVKNEVLDACLKSESPEVNKLDV